MMIRKVVVPILLWLMITLSAWSYPVVVKDSRGVSVTIRKEPHRIVSLTPSNTEILFALGVGNRIVGVTSTENYPPAAKKLPVIGDANPSLERILAKKPDLVLGVASLQTELLARLNRMGVTVVSVDPKNFNDVIKSVNLVGKAVGRPRQAALVVQKMKTRLDGVKRRTSKLKKHPRVFVEIWNKPLMTAGPQTFVNEMIRLAGGVNVASDARAGYVQFSEEALLARNPQVIILPCRNRSEVMKRSRWKNVSAVRDGRVYNFNPDLLVRPGPRLVDGLEQLERLMRTK
jgi:iron complex transport system substrate-binding protein